VRPVLTSRDLRLPLTIPARVVLIVLVVVYLVLMADRAVAWFQSGDLILTPLGLLAIVGPTMFAVWLRTFGWQNARDEWSARRGSRA